MVVVGEGDWVDVFIEVGDDFLFVVGYVVYDFVDGDIGLVG